MMFAIAITGYNNGGFFRDNVISTMACLVEAMNKDEAYGIAKRITESSEIRSQNFDRVFFTVSCTEIVPTRPVDEQFKLVESDRKP